MSNKTPAKKITITNIFDGDKVDAYLLFSNPHQYGK